MAEERIKAVSFKCDEVGKYMKGSKKRFEWVIGLNSRTHTIVLDFSFISGKVKAYVDGRVLLQNEIPLNTSFQHPFTLDGFALNLIQQGQNCELRINNKVFSHLYTQERTNQEFKQDESEFGISMNKDFMNKLNNGGNKITLDIGGQKKNFSKKPKQGEDEWGGFGGIGFPTGFEAPPGMEATQHKGAIGGFGSEFDAPTKVEQASSGPIDFFGDDAPSQPVAKVAATTDIMGTDLLSGGTSTTSSVTQSAPQQPSIESLYQQTSIMNTNQLLFNTGLQQQQYQQPQQQYQQQIGLSNVSGTGVQPASFTTGLALNQMFNTSVPNTGFNTGMNQPTFPVTMNTGMNNISMNTGIAPTPATNPSFQTGAAFPTSMNLNQLFQTGVQQQQPAASIADLTSLTTSTQQQQPYSGQMFPTSAGSSTVTSGITFNTTVLPAANKDLFDLM